MTSFNTSFPPLTFTGDSLNDVIGLIRAGNIVALYCKTATRVFHTIDFDFKQTTIAESLKNVRVIYLDCEKDETLLCDGEWEWYIKQAVSGVKELARDNELRNVI